MDRLLSEISQTKMSVVRNVHCVETAPITLGAWINATRNGCRHTDAVLEYRSTGDMSIKFRRLPAISPGALMRTRAAEIRFEEKVESITGLMQFDIDEDHNPGLSDWPGVRDAVARIAYVFFAALSVSEAGVYGFVMIEHPDRYRDHFDQLKRDFGARGIVLDKSKGGNPTDLRIYSYDPSAYVAESFRVYDRLPVPKKASRRRYQAKTNGVHTDAMDVPLRMVLDAPDGEKHHALNKAAYLAGGRVAAGFVDEQAAFSELESAIASRDNVRSLEAARRTIRDGIRDGQSEPAAPPFRKRSGAPSNERTPEGDQVPGPAGVRHARGTGYVNAAQTDS